MDKKKKKLIIIFSVIGVVILAAAIALAVIFTREPEEPPATGKNVVYQTEAESFWTTFGTGYMTFETVPASEAADGELSGQVFRVWAKNNDAWEAWLVGTWEMNEAETELKLTASWDVDDANATVLADAVSGQTKTYTAENGKFSIKVNYPGGATGEVTFTLDPVADKVGEGETVKPPCTQHVDANNDGMCDNCGAQIQTPPAQVVETLTLTASTRNGQSAKIVLSSDNTWKLAISYYQGGDYYDTASGTYAEDQSENIVLTVTNDAADVLAQDSYTLSYDADTETYSLTMVCAVPEVGSLEFVFGGDTTPAVTVTETLVANTLQGQSAKIELMSDSTWKLSIAYYQGGEYYETASGTYAVDTGSFSLILTVTTDTAEVLDEDSYSFTPDYITYLYSGDISCNIPTVGTINFSFASVKADPTVRMTFTASSATGEQAKIEVMSDNTWKLFISYYQGGEYYETAGGTCGIDMSGSLSLTVTSDVADVLSEDAYSFTKDSGTSLYGGTVVCSVPQTSAGELNFAFVQQQ